VDFGLVTTVNEGSTDHHSYRTEFKNLVEIYMLLEDVKE
jgi:hypothetical protein